MRRLLLLIVSVVLVVSACGTSGTATGGTTWSSGHATTATPNGQSDDEGTPKATAPAPLHIQVTGTCRDPGGLRLRSSGFTPGGEYLTRAWYPSGASYTYLLNGGYGTAGPQGDTPTWRWNCYQGANNRPDPAGRYKLTLVDLATNRKATTHFTVQYH